ncbi:MAG: hypothetical protein ACP5SI_04155 [Chloroflexia bacterium]
MRYRPRTVVLLFFFLLALVGGCRQKPTPQPAVTAPVPIGPPAPTRPATAAPLPIPTTDRPAFSLTVLHTGEVYGEVLPCG